MTLLPMQGPLADPDTMPQIGALANNMPTLKGGGMFGGKLGANPAIMAAVAGFLSRRNPQLSSSMMQMLMDRQRQAQEEAQYQRKRQDDFTDFKQEYDYKLAHPTASDSEFERAAVAGGYQPGTPQYAELMRRKAEAMANPVVMTPYGPMPYSAVAGAQNMPQIGAVLDDPRRQGGAGGNVSGNFPY
jgi:hypothetical protein